MKLPNTHIDNIKLIATDIDGTLMDDNKQLPKDFYDTLDKLYTCDIKFIIASGRQLDSLLKEFKRISDKVYFIAENGGVISKGDNVIHTNCFTLDETTHFIHNIRKLSGAQLILCTPDCAYIESDDDYFINQAKIYYTALKKVDDLLYISKQFPTCKFTVFHPNGAEHTIYKDLLKLKDKYQINLSGKLWVDCMKLGINKGTSIEYLLKKFNLTKDNAAAFGDYLNDYDMIKSVTHSFSMANAHPLLLENSKYIAPSNNEWGVTYCINNYIL